MTTSQSSRSQCALRILVALLALSFAIACSHSSDEEQIRAIIDSAEKAVEARDTSAVMELIAADYRDGQGFDKTQLRSFLRGYFITHPKIELIVRIADIKLETANSARVRVEFAMVGTQLGNADRVSLAGESESQLVELRRLDGEWRITRVDRVGRPAP
jgi:ketosteroid isomerase-like protein